MFILVAEHIPFNAVCFTQGDAAMQSSKHACNWLCVQQGRSASQQHTPSARPHGTDPSSLTSSAAPISLCRTRQQQVPKHPHSPASSNIGASAAASNFSFLRALRQLPNQSLQGSDSSNASFSAAATFLSRTAGSNSGSLCGCRSSCSNSARWQQGVHLAGEVWASPAGAQPRSLGKGFRFAPHHISTPTATL